MTAGRSGRRWRPGLTLQLFVAFAIVSLVPLGAFAFIAIRDQADTINRQSHDALVRTQSSATEDVDRLFEVERSHIVGMTAVVDHVVDEVLRSPAKRRRSAARAFFDDIRSVVPGHVWVGIVSRQGNVLVATDRRSIGLDVASEPWFRQGLRGFTELPARRQAIVAGKPAFALADSDGGPVVAAMLGMQALDDALGPGPAMSASATFITNAQDQLLSRESSQGAPWPKIAVMGVPVGGGFAAAARRPAGASSEVTIAGATWTAVVGAAGPDKLGLRVFAAQEVSALHAPVRDTTRRAVVALIIAAAAAAVAGALLAGGIALTRRRAEGRLRASEERRRLITDNMSEAFWVATADLNQILYVNDAWGRIWGRPKEDLYENPAIWAEGIHPEDRDRVLSSARSLTEGVEDDVEFRILRPDGEVRWVRARVKPVRDEKEVLRRAVGMVEDITDRRTAQAAADAEHAQAEAAGRAKTEFLENMSHEFRTPLNSIVGFADALRESGDLTDEQRTFIDFIAQGGERLDALIGDVLDLSDLEVRMRSSEPLPVEPREIIDRVLGVLAADIRAKRLLVSSNVESGASMCVQDPRDLKQIVYQLLSNAVKFTPTDREISVTVSLDPEDESMMLFEVVDTGVGISDEDRQRLFRPFAQLDQTTTKRAQGAGLGLSIVAAIAERLGGKVGVESQPAKGSRFWVSIPAVARPDDPPGGAKGA